jgi:hypothetical protein
LRGGGSASEKRHYVLVVAPTASMDMGGRKIYERVGAGFLLGSCIKLDGPGLPVKIH